MKTKFLTTAICIIALFSVDLSYGYHPISPYAYCYNNPIKYIDPDGRDGMLSGVGTKDDPYVIKANYYYENGSLSQDQIKGLNGAIDSYNNNGKARIVKDADGNKIYVKYDFTAQGVDNVSAAVTGDIFTKDSDGQAISLGNRLGTSPNAGGNGEEFGSANGWRVDINSANIDEAVNGGQFGYSVIKGTYIHEIGHNLGLDHHHNTKIMSLLNVVNIVNQMGPSTTIYTYPSVDNNGVGIMINNVNMPRVGSLGVIRTK